MGQLSLIAVVGAFLISGVVVLNAHGTAGDADNKVLEHQYHVIARDAASTGMSGATYRLGANINVAWNALIVSALSQTDVAFGGGRYTVTATAATDACSILSTSNYSAAISQNGFVVDGDIIEVVATGTHVGAVGDDPDALQRHRLVACFMKADYGLFAPPAFNYGFISDDDFTFNGGPTIQALVDGQGHVHSNGDMSLGPRVEIDGHATYTGNPDIHRNTQVASHGTGPTVPLTAFDADEFALDNNVSAASCGTAPNHCRYDAGYVVGASGLTVVAPPVSDPDHREGDPFIWYIDGDFTLSGGAHIQVPQYTTIVVKGNVSISGGAAVTVTGQTAQDMFGNNPTDAQSRQWVESQLFDGVHSPLAWYGTGTATLGGTPGVVGNFYVNGNVELNGGGNGNNTAGSFASADGTITANGGGSGNNFWFLEVAEENVVEGVMLPGKQIVRLALAEWTDPVLDN